MLAGVKDLRTEVDAARQRLDRHGLRTILFIDEVHRFNSAQQDALLPWVENGTLTLIGATTENPYFEVNKALVSRSGLFGYKPWKPMTCETSSAVPSPIKMRLWRPPGMITSKRSTIWSMWPMGMPAACSMPWSWRWKVRPGCRQRHDLHRPHHRRERSNSVPFSTTNRGTPISTDQCLHRHSWIDHAALFGSLAWVAQEKIPASFSGAC